MMSRRYSLGHNQFSDWTQREYASILTYNETPEEERNYVTFDTTDTSPIDWRDNQVVTRVKD